MCATHVVWRMPEAPHLRPVEFDILLTLAAGERHGYAIIQETEARSDGELVLETGTMYRALRRLVAAGLARPTARRASSDGDDERRRYYAITALGRSAASAEAARMARLVRAARGARLLPSPRGA
jgi:DNA-binding PadR family transcriptional regulator